MASRLRARGVLVGGLGSGGSTPEEILEFAEVLGPDLPYWQDTAHAVARRFEIRTVPRVLILRTGGRVEMVGGLDPESIPGLERRLLDEAYRY